MTEFNPQKPNLEQRNVEKNVIKVDPGTLLAIVVAVLFLPLLLAGLFSH